ncbi:hypothetical protein CD790_10345 [Streptomyces sp. SAJ15]|nr:hypothetical protein CD790_10345 [Streptomyces sp. SAJ15]
MPRGRHRQAPPLHRLLPPTSVAAASIACAAGAWLAGEVTVVRGLAAAASAAAVVGAVLLRRWDRAAGKRVAELTKARAREEWRAEERMAELEADVEEAREARAALNGKLRAKRAELARLRNEHAELLRRYATAETERARALEGRRQLALGVTDDDPDDLDGGVDVDDIDAAERVADLLSRAVLSAELYRRADAALRRLEEQEWVVERAEQPLLPEPARPLDAAGARELTDAAASARSVDAAQPAEQVESAEPVESAECVEPAEPVESAESVESVELVESAEPIAAEARTEPSTAAVEPAAGVEVEDGESAAEPASAAARPAPESDDAERPTPAHARTVASAVVPYAAARRTASRLEGGFDFFGNQKQGPQPKAAAESGAGAEPAGAAAEEDLADVVGAEALAAAEAEAAAEAAARAEDRRDADEIIDLTAHDETEQIDVAQLRSAIS